MKKQTFMSIIGALALLGGLFSCGETSSENKPSGSNSASVSTSTSGSVSTSTKPSGPIDIDFWHTSGAGVSNGYNEAAKSFSELVKKNEGVDVNVTATYQGGYPDVLNKVINSLAAGTAPTITIAYPDHVADYIALEKGTQGKYVVNLEDLASDENIGFGKESYLGDGEASDFVEAFYTEGQNYLNEGMYSLPLMKSTEVMYYNLDLVMAYAKKYDASLNSEAAVETWLSNISWADFMAFNKFLADNWKHPTDDGKEYFPVWYDSDSNLFISQSYQRNIPYISIKDNKLSADFNNAEAKAMVNELKGYHDEGILTTKGASNNTYGSAAFVEERCIFCVGSSGGAGYQDPSTGGFEYRIAEVPFSNNNKKYVTQGPTVALLRNPGDTDAVNDLKVKYAWKFLKYLTSTEVNTSLCVNDSQGYIPVRTSCYSSDLYQEYLNEETIYSATAKVVLDDIGEDSYLVSPSIKGSADARTNVGGIISGVFSGNKTIDDAFAKAVQETLLKS